MAASGDSSSVKNYSYEDITISASLNYYRLKMVDRDDRFTYSSVLRLTGSASFALEAVPNPFENELNVRITVEKGGAAELLINNAEGKLLRRKNITLQKGATSFSISDFAQYASGVYTLTVKTDADVKTIKLIKK